jgi:hypothetical protein
MTDEDLDAEPARRVEADRAKATRLGHAARPDLRQLDGDIRRLLWTSPSDLAAATRPLVAYQRLLQEAASGHASGRSA